MYLSCAGGGVGGELCITSPICWLPLPRMLSAALHHFQYPSVGEAAEAES